MVRPATPLGPVGLILPTLPQDTIPLWAGRSGFGRTDSTTGTSEVPALDPITELATVCRQAEDAGAGALWACDHLFWHTPVLECMTALTVAATATRRAVLGTCVVQLPLRQAPAVAKQAASLQLLSRGRLVLGVGVGSHSGEYDQAGADFHRRGRLLDRGIAELRRSWASGTGMLPGDLEAGGERRYRQLPGATDVPVWVGGSSEAALRRAATLADGWIPLFLGIHQYADALERLGKVVADAGRRPGSVTPSIVLFVSVDQDRMAAVAKGTAWMSSLYGIPAKAFERHLVAGSAEEVARVVWSYHRAGAEHVAVYVADDRPIHQFERVVSTLSQLPSTGVQDPSTGVQDPSTGPATFDPATCTDQG